MAQQLGSFARFEANREPMLRVIRNHRRAAYAAPAKEYEGLTVTPVTHAPTLFTQETWALARKMWDDALSIGEVAGYRNAQVTVTAPTGTIGLVMDCDTTGIEPDFALVKFKKLAGGGYFKIVNQSVDAALHKLGYSQEQIDAIETYAKGTGTLDEAPHINRATLKAKGFDDEAIARVETALPSAFELPFVFNKFVSGRGVLQREARPHRRATQRLELLDSARRPRIHHAADRRSVGAHLRPHDRRGRALPQRRAPCRLRLRDAMRQVRLALHSPARARRHDGGRAAMGQRSNYQRR